MLVIAIFLFVDALPSVQSKVHTIPLKKRANKFIARNLENFIIDNQADIAYYGEIILAESEDVEAQNLQVKFDTGSADFFVPSDCNYPVCEDKFQYVRGEDGNFVDINKKFHVNYFKGSFRGNATGNSGTTTFSFVEGIEVGKQEFGFADFLSPEFEGTEFDGVLGMALSVASQNGQITPISNLINEDQLDNPQFSFMLGRHEDHVESELTIGGTNPDRYFEPINWIHLTENNEGFWRIPLENFFIGAQPFDLQGRTATIDTGSSSIIVPLNDVEDIYAKIPNSNTEDGRRYTIPCEINIAISLTFGGVNWNVDRGDFVIQSENENVCFGAIVGENIPGIYTILFNCIYK